VHRPAPSSSGAGSFEDELTLRLLAHIENRELLERLDTLPSRKDITAWVADNDHTALSLLSLRAARRLSGAIAVAGFDNLSESLAADLTTFDFNLDGLCRAVVSHLVNPGTARSGVTEIRGFIVERGSTRIRSARV